MDTELPQEIPEGPAIPQIPAIPCYPPATPQSSLMNILNNQTQTLIAVEQLSLNGEFCFVCGDDFGDCDLPLTFGASDLVPGSSVTLLDLLGAGLGVGLATDRPETKICQNCGKLVTSLNSAFANLFSIRQQVFRLFHGNNKPKLTLQLIPKTSSSSSSSSSGSSSSGLTNTTTSLNLDDLAATRSRRGRKRGVSTTMTTATTTTTTTTATTTGAATDPTVPKRKGGRPRKPFPCNFCRRKFLTTRAVERHVNSDHSTYNTFGPTYNATTTTTTTTRAGATTSVKIEASEMVKMGKNGQSSSLTLMKGDSNLALTGTQDSSLSLTGAQDSNLALTGTQDSNLALTGTQDSNLTLTGNQDSNLALTGTQDSNLALTGRQDSNLALTGSQDSNLALTSTQHSSLALTKSQDGTFPLTKSSENLLQIPSPNANSSAVPPGGPQDSTFPLTKSSENLLHIQPPAKPSTNQVLASLRPIQPKPQTIRTHNQDGSLLVVVNSAENSALIKMSPNYPTIGTKTILGKTILGKDLACECCGKTFIDDTKRRMHFIAAHGKRRQTLRRTDTDAHGATRFTCKSCDDTFLTRKELNVHRRTHAKTYTCAYCDQRFTNKNELNTHTETHTLAYIQTDAHEFMCALCGLHVASKTALKIHVHRFHAHTDTHTDVHSENGSQYLCAYCGHLSRTRKAFTNHQRIHEKNAHGKNAHEKTVTCTYCQKAMLGSSLRTHVRRMHGEAVYTCAYCSERFCVRADLMRHTNIHHYAHRPYKCTHEPCTQTFRTSDALRYHKTKVHATKTFDCNKCQKKFKWKTELKAHLNRSHTQTYGRTTCSICYQDFQDSKKLNRHIETKHQDKPPPPPPPPPTTIYHTIYHNPDNGATTTTTTTAATTDILSGGDLSGDLSGEIYLVPNLSVPIHEEQVNTT